MWRRVARDSAILVGSSFSLVLLQVAYRFLSLQALSVSAYGRVALLLSVFNAATVLGVYGVPATVSRLAARTAGRTRDRELLRSASLAVALPSLLASGVMAVATYIVIGSAAGAIVAFAGVPPVIWAGISRGFLRGKGMIWWSAAIQPVNLIVQTGALLFLLAAGANPGIGLVLASFYAGNFAAMATGSIAARRWLMRGMPPDDEADDEATPRGILAFSSWLSAANLAVIMLAILPRVALAHWSYREVAFFDLALLVYSLPQRLRSSFLVALLPIAALEQKRGNRIVVPNLVDLLFITSAFVVLDLMLWVTDAVPRAFGLLHMSTYDPAAPLLLLMLLAAPAELFFGLNSALLQSFGQSRRLTTVTLAVLAVSGLLIPGAARLGSTYLIVLLVLDYWALYAYSRRMLALNGIDERSVVVPATAQWMRAAVSRWSARHRAAAAAADTVDPEGNSAA